MSSVAESLLCIYGTLSSIFTLISRTRKQKKKIPNILKLMGSKNLRISGFLLKLYNAQKFPLKYTCFRTRACYICVRWGYLSDCILCFRYPTTINLEYNSEMILLMIAVCILKIYGEINYSHHCKNSNLK